MSADDRRRADARDWRSIWAVARRATRRRWADAGWRVLGLDLSLPMLDAARRRADAARRLAPGLLHHGTPAGRRPGGRPGDRPRHLESGLVVGRVPAGDRRGGSSRQAGRRIVRLHLLPQHPAAWRRAHRGEPFVFTQFSGRPQCFLSEAQLIRLLRRSASTPNRTRRCGAERGAITNLGRRAAGDPRRGVPPSRRLSRVPGQRNWLWQP